jgi:hypothetical protein
MTILFTILLLIIPLLTLGYGVGAIFFANLRREMVQRKWAFAFLVAVSLLCLFLVIPHGNGANAAKALTQYRLHRVWAAIMNYESEYSSPPATAENAPLMKVLRANNPKKDVFLNLERGERNKKGEIVDAWGTPLRISLDDPNNPVVQSAGPDKVWGTKDDMSSDSTR